LKSTIVFVVLVYCYMLSICDVLHFFTPTSKMGFENYIWIPFSILMGMCVFYVLMDMHVCALLSH
jgi:hypothetical protein